MEKIEEMGREVKIEGEKYISRRKVREGKRRYAAKQAGEGNRILRNNRRMEEE